MKKSIAIVGAGVSGLAAAWGLRNYPGRVVLYDKSSSIGGNCQSRQIAVGDEYRFCDLGVNDFNTRAYSSVLEAMDEVGIEYGLLEDSACFYSDTSSYAYTIGGLNYHRAMPEGIAAEYARFQTEAAQYYKDHPNTNCSIGEYLYNIASPAYSTDFGEHCIFPRVNAMYFMDPDKQAADMSFKAVMHYYILQEGFGTAYGPLRMYFKDGAQNWLKRLAQFLNRNIVLNADVRIQANLQNPAQASYTLSYTNSRNEVVDEVFDQVIFACHSDAIAPMVSGSAVIQTLQEHVLRKVRYAPSVAYAHTYTGILPPDVNLWRTYNVTVHDATHVGGKTYPYSMTYVCNKHQNDAKSGTYNNYGGPQILVTLNPREDVKKILDDEIKAMQATPSVAPLYMLCDANTHAPIVWSFPHNIVDNASIRAQDDLVQFQGREGLFFTGGWTQGAGLHEECWIQSQAVATAIQTGLPFDKPTSDQNQAHTILKALRAR